MGPFLYKRNIMQGEGHYEKIGRIRIIRGRGVGGSRQRRYNHTIQTRENMVERVVLVCKDISEKYATNDIQLYNFNQETRDIFPR